MSKRRQGEPQIGVIRDALRWRDVPAA